MTKLLLTTALTTTIMAAALPVLADDVPATNQGSATMQQEHMAPKGQTIDRATTVSDKDNMIDAADTNKHDAATMQGDDKRMDDGKTE